MDDWLTIKEAADILKLSEHTVRDQVRQGKIPSTKLGHRTVRVRREDIEALLPPMERLPSMGAQVRIDRGGVGNYLLGVIAGEGTDTEKLATIRAFALGLVAE